MNWSLMATRALELLEEEHNLTAEDVASLKGKIEYWASALGAGKKMTKEFKQGSIKVNVTAKADAVEKIEIQ